MSFTTEVLILAIICSIPILIFIYLIIKSEPDYDGINWSAIAIFQLTVIWSIIPGMFWFKLLDIYNIWPY